MSRPSLSPYEKLTFEEAIRILYYHWGEKAGLFKEFIEDLMGNADSPYRSITPRWYDEYKQYLADNKNSK
ncbi:MAG: hypothetical protein ACJ749_17635 [Flavisolibacter sp.]|jgi:hypothetical protein